jgi:hypothetical protein
MRVANLARRSDVGRRRAAAERDKNSDCRLHIRTSAGRIEKLLFFDIDFLPDFSITPTAFDTGPFLEKSNKRSAIMR